MMDWKNNWSNDDWKTDVPQVTGPEAKPIESVTIFGVAVHVGDRVRLWPQKNADIMDMALKEQSRHCRGD